MALTPEQIDGLKEAFGKIAQPINDWLLQDAARRIRQAAEYAGEPGGKMTRTAAYELWRAKAMGESEREMKVFLRRQLKLSNQEICTLFRQAARFSRDNDEERVGLTGGADLEQMTAAAVKLAQKDFTNLTQTLGMVGRNGKAQPLQKFYQETMDFAFEQVFTGAADYETAMRQATQKMADAGVRTIDYASGRSTSLEAAVRRNLMGGMGLLDEQITQANHDALGCNGWEITAHRNSAPDHEPYQGKQFSDAEWEKLNGTKEKPGILKRRIETLNCNHHPMPIILGVNAPQYTDAELAAMREENAKGITYEGKHYTGYEATQKQRQIERNMRMQKNRILVSEQLEDKAKKQAAQIKLQMLRQHYKAFSKAANLPLQEERAWVAEYTRNASNTRSQMRKPVLLEGKTVETKMGSVNLRKVRGYDSNVFVSEKVHLESEEIRAFVKRTHKAMNEWGIPKKYKPQIQIVGYGELGAYGSYDPRTDVVRYAAEIKSQDELDLLPLKYSNIVPKSIPKFGETERHEMWHMNQAVSFRERGWNITQQNYLKYLKILRSECKIRLDSLGITKDNIGEVSLYADTMYKHGLYDEAEAEYMVHKRGKE